MAKLIEIETERLRLRQWIESDREPFARLNADPRVMEFFPSILDRAASDASVDRASEKIHQHGWGLWATEAIDRGAKFARYRQFRSVQEYVLVQVNRPKVEVF